MGTYLDVFELLRGGGGSTVCSSLTFAAPGFVSEDGSSGEPVGMAYDGGPFRNGAAASI